MTSSRNHPLVLLVVIASTLAGCGTDRPKSASAPAPYVPRVQRLADFATNPDGDPVYECIRSALQTQYGLVAMKSGQASDDQVAKALVGSLQDSALRRQRDAEGGIWKQTRNPAAVAQAHLDWCVGTTRVALDRPPGILACLQSVEPADLFSIAHAGGRTREVALEAARARYRGFFTDDQLTLLSMEVYALTTEDADIRFRATRFGQCLATR
jgi:hypothetical protein